MPIRELAWMRRRRSLAVVAKHLASQSPAAFNLLDKLVFGVLIKTLEHFLVSSIDFDSILKFNDSCDP
jgi:hypothetical protein